MDNVGSIYLDLGLNTGKFNSQLMGIQNTVGGSNSGLTKSFMGLGKAMIGIFAVKQLVQFGAEAIKLGSSLTEIQNVIDVTFGRSSTKVDAWSKDAMKSFGLTELAAKEFTGTMGAVMKSMGASPGSAAKMSMDLVGRVGDVASFRNKDALAVSEKFASAISGETEAMRTLGVVMTQTNLANYMMQQGMKGNYADLTENNKLLVRYGYILQATADAQGDFARTSGTWANQTRILAGQWDQFKASMGQGLINLFNPILQTINTLMPKLIEFAALFQSITASIFGDAAASITTIAVSSDDAGDGMDDFGAGIAKAGKAAKGSLASFDRLNVLTSEIGSGGSGGGGGGSVTKVVTDTKKASDEMYTYGKKSSVVLDTIKKIVEGVKEWGRIIWETGLKSFFEDIWGTLTNIWDIGKRIFSWLNDLSRWAGGSGNIVNDLAWLIGQGFKLAGEGLHEVSIWLDLISKGDWAGLGTRMSAGIENGLNAINTALTNWSNGLPDWAKNILGIDTSIASTHTSASGAIHGGGGASMGGSGGRSFDSGGGGRSIGYSGGYGGASTAKPISLVPQMAAGGIVSRPTLAIVGDNKRSAEAIIPLNQMDKYMGGGANSELVREVRESNRLLAQLLAKENGTYLDGKQLGEGVLPYVTAAAKRSQTAWPVRA